MNVLLISQCDKRALKQTRRILDQFAERRGTRTWQTPITKQGLDTLRGLLRRSARRNSAIACHWIRGLNHSELLWIVGDAGRFNAQGAVPTNTTERDILRRDDENDWHTGRDIELLAALAALFHDLGKACDAFQSKLFAKGKPERNIYRHEWISLRLLQAFVGTSSDEEWLKRLAEPSRADDAVWLQRLEIDGAASAPKSPFKTLPPLARAIGWLIVSHHRLPLLPNAGDFQVRALDRYLNQINARWNENNPETSESSAKPYWKFSRGLPVTSERWKAKVSAVSSRMVERKGFAGNDWVSNPYVMHLARLSLMLADHYYSSLPPFAGNAREPQKYELFANTDWNDQGERVPKQRLVEHLIGVEDNSHRISRALPSLYDALPKITRHKGFRRRTKNPDFRWQDKAFDLAESLRTATEQQGFFGVNMASTGCGKTLANGRIIYALAHPAKGARFTIALGLRTLTLQTGREYRRVLDLDAADLAIRVGGGAVKQLHEHYQKQSDTGSESMADLLEDNSHVHYEGQFEKHPILKRITHDPQAQALIQAPILTCTVDHLVPATESLRGGRQIAPMLRLITGDLILDEPDDFDLDDLPALARLVHWSGLLGSRVLLSSATLPPAIVQGLFDAYCAGRKEYQRNRGVPGQPLNICCAWFDEHRAQSHNCSDNEQFAAAHLGFAKQRVIKLAAAAARRMPLIKPLTLVRDTQKSLREQFAEQTLPYMAELHASHADIDEQSGKRVSFGLVRMANIEPLIDVARALYSLGAPPDTRIHLCVYHANHPLIIRSRIEHQLDQALDRREPHGVFKLPDIRQRLDAYPEPNQLFVVLASPVAEVGRDHDYDWAIVEPSSERSIIQLAGRVRRHRPPQVDHPNIYLLETNLRHLRQPGAPAFCRPGFETKNVMLKSHLLTDLLASEELEKIDARPRIQQREPLLSRERLSDLEHDRLHALLTGQSDLQELGAFHWWRTQAHLLGVMQQQQRFRKSSGEEDFIRLMLDESGEAFYLERIEKDGSVRDIDQQQHHRLELAVSPCITPWGDEDYMQALNELAEEFEMTPQDAAARFGTVSLRSNPAGWEYHPALGFRRKQ